MLEELATWPPGNVEFRPADDEWTAAEVLDHVARSESGMFADLRAGLETPHRIVPEDPRMVEAVARSLRSDARFKVPAGGVHPGEGAPRLAFETWVQDNERESRTFP